MHAMDIAPRAAGCIAFWHLACTLRDGQFGAFFKQYEPIAFLIFCIHGMAGGIWWMVVVHSGVAASGTGVLAYFLLSPLLVLVTPVLAAWVSPRVVPHLFALMLSGLAPSMQQATRMFWHRPFGLGKHT